MTKEGKHKLAKKGKTWSLALLVIVLISVSVLCYWWFFRRNKVSTDDAYVMADTATVSSRIQGNISKIYVENDQWVKKGDRLIELDPSDYKIALDEAEAALSQIKAQLAMSKVTIEMTQAATEAKIREAKASLKAAIQHKEQISKRLDELAQARAAALADFKEAKKDLSRFNKLYKLGATSEQRRDSILTIFKKAKARLEGTDAQIASAKASLNAAQQEISRAKAALDSAVAQKLKVSLERHRRASLNAQAKQIEAKLAAVKLRLSYCTIKAPISGYIAQKKIQVGNHVQPGQPLLAVVPLHHIYIEANFKETQLEHVRIGQPATIEADMYPGHKYHGHVVGIRAGTGAAFSLLPPENATGNWIKVVQRVPVKIYLDQPPPPAYPLRVGLSLHVTIDTSLREGQSLKPRN